MSIKYSINKIILNRDLIANKEIKRIISSLADKSILTAKGGFLIKSTVIGSVIHLAVIPYQIDGERTYHYNMIMPENAEYILTGFINSNLSLTLIIDNKKYKELNRVQKKEFLIQYVLLSKFLIENGFNKNFSLDVITLQVINNLTEKKNYMNNIFDLANLSVEAV